MASATEASQRGAAYANRESVSTRNPHNASRVSDLSKHLKELSKLPQDKRLVGQWRAALGCPLSDEAKAQFRIHAVGKTFNLADVRLWVDHHKERPGDKSTVKQIFLEFFFDGSTDELEGNQEEFTKAFENMVEQQLQEVRIKEFRKKLTARRRRGGEDAVEACDGEGGASNIADDDWKEFLSRPTPSADFSIQSMREAGCMLRFLVCQTSLSVHASEILGQLCFQEHFPIDGIEQEPSKSTKPLPRWFFCMVAFTVIILFITLVAWWQIVKAALPVREVLPDNPM